MEPERPDEDLWLDPIRPDKFPPHPLCQAGPNLLAQEEVERVRGGDIEALKRVFECLRAYLIGEAPLPLEFARLCADRFQLFARSSALNKAIGDQGVEVAGKEVVYHWPSIHQPRPVAATFSAAFYLQAAQGMGSEAAEACPDPRPLAHPLSAGHCDAIGHSTADKANRGCLTSIRIILETLPDYLRGVSPMRRDFARFWQESP